MYPVSRYLYQQTSVDLEESRVIPLIIWEIPVIVMNCGLRSTPVGLVAILFFTAYTLEAIRIKSFFKNKTISLLTGVSNWVSCLLLKLDFDVLFK